MYEENFVLVQDFRVQRFLVWLEVWNSGKMCSWRGVGGGGKPFTTRWSESTGREGGGRGESSTSFKDDLISHRTEESTPSLPKVPQVGNRIFRHKPLETHCSPSYRYHLVQILIPVTSYDGEGAIQMLRGPVHT